MQPAMSNVRDNVVRKRAELRLSQSALAARARVSRPTVSKIEQGDANVTIATLEKIAVVLRCRVNELFEPRRARVVDAEIERRANAPESDFIDARALSRAIQEANEVRYSNAGRPRR
jgi:transcriptional regulator with XRE-family HTH domain